MQQQWLSLLTGLCLFTLYHVSKDAAVLSRRAKVLVVTFGTSDPPFYEGVLSILTSEQPVDQSSASHHANNVTAAMWSNESHQLRNTENKLSQIANVEATPNTTQHSSSQPFPRWKGGISISSLVEAIHVSLDGKLKHDRAHKVYIVDERGLRQAAVPRSHSADPAPLRRGKRMEALAASVIRRLTSTSWDATRTYPYLMSAMRQGGFAYIANHADSKFCCDDTHFVDSQERPVSNASVPIFTLSSPKDCTHSFPNPTYETIKHAEKSWAKHVVEYRTTYPWTDKQRQAVWRGAPTGDARAANNTRVQLCELAERRPDLVDAKLTRKRRLGFVNLNETKYLGTKMPMQDFMKYRAIIDVDGHSWSSRFGELLCYSSVILKVQPANVDYFYPQLQPWVHYIPVKADLSDLFEKVQFAVSDEHTADVQQIIANANEWCVANLNTERISADLAHIWDLYAKFLYEADANWSEVWAQERKELLAEYTFTPVE